MRWPRGRYNGKKIGGLDARLVLDVLWWRWLPSGSLRHGTLSFHWLFVHLWVEASYSGRPLAEEPGATPRRGMQPGAIRGLRSQWTKYALGDPSRLRLISTPQDPGPRAALEGE